MITLKGKFENTFKYVFKNYLYYKSEDLPKGQKFRCANFRWPCSGSVFKNNNGEVDIIFQHSKDCEPYENYVADSKCWEEVVQIAKMDKDRKFAEILRSSNAK